MNRKTALYALAILFSLTTTSYAATVTESYNLATASLTLPDNPEPDTSYTIEIEGNLLESDGFGIHSYRVYENATWSYSDSTHLVTVESGTLIDQRGVGFGDQLIQSYTRSNPAGTYKYTFIFGDRRGNHAWYDVAVDAYITIQPQIATIPIDIKPGDESNAINLASAGVIPVALLSTPEFNAATKVKPESVSLSGATVKVVGKSEKHLCHEEYINNDTLVDLLCQVYTAEFLIVPGESTATLTAETTDGNAIQGQDTIQVIKY